MKHQFLHIQISIGLADPVLRLKNRNGKQKKGIQMEHWLKMCKKFILTGSYRSHYHHKPLILTIMISSYHAFLPPDRKEVSRHILILKKLQSIVFYATQFTSNVHSITTNQCYVEIHFELNDILRSSVEYFFVLATTYSWIKF